MIIDRMTDFNQDRFDLHTIAFGGLADPKFLSKLALRNGGKMEKIFDDMDAAVQVNLLCCYG